MFARLHIAMHEPRRVCRVERGCDSADEPDGAIRLERALTLQQLAEIASVDERHCEEQHALGLARVECAHDVRVIELRSQCGLPDEPLPEALVLGQRRDEDLERHLVPRRDVLGQVHVPHGAGAERRAHPEARDERADVDASQPSPRRQS